MRNRIGKATKHPRINGDLSIEGPAGFSRRPFAIVAAMPAVACLEMNVSATFAGLLVPPLQRSQGDLVGIVLEVLGIVEGARMPLPLGNCGRRVIKLTDVMIGVLAMPLAVGQRRCGQVTGSAIDTKLIMRGFMCLLGFEFFFPWWSSWF